MTKIEVQPTSEQPSPLGLSHRPYLTVLGSNGLEVKEERSIRIHVKSYDHGEMLIRSFNKPEVNRNDRTAPPVNIGERVQENGLSKRGRSRITRAGRYYQQTFGRANMITVGYGDISLSCHTEAKKDLDRFLKTLTRYVKAAHNSPLHYVWVAEIQEKRKERTGIDVIHFHILTPHHIPKEVINKAWNNAVNKPRIKAGKAIQTLYPQIIAAYHAGKYIAKYCQKEGHRIVGNGYNMSQVTSKGITATYEQCFDVTEETYRHVKDIASKTLKDRNTDAYVMSGEFKDNQWYQWVSSGNSYALHELIEYHLGGNESIAETNNLEDDIKHHE